MFKFILENVEKQLKEDSHGNYKAWLIEKLNQYKEHYEEIKINQEKSKEIKKNEYMIQALDAAILIIIRKQQTGIHKVNNNDLF